MSPGKEAWQYNRNVRTPQAEVVVLQAGFARTGLTHCLLEVGGFKIAPGRKARARRTTAQEKRRRLLCAHCGHAITEADQRIEMAGTHAHRFCNPAGWVYDIGCFRIAPGCNHVGELIAEHTWFAGYRWQIAVCGRCGEHMGWRYQGGTGTGDGFHGLILERLVSEQ